MEHDRTLLLVCTGIAVAMSILIGLVVAQERSNRSEILTNRAVTLENREVVKRLCGPKEKQA